MDYHTYQLTLNRDNLITTDPTKSTYEYTFSGTVKFERGSKIALSKINLFYSWFNITSDFNNNTFSYIWTDGSGSTTVSVTIPDGFYSVSVLNSYLQSVFIEQGHYLVNAEGDNVYYLEIEENPSRYAVQINAYPFPTSLPSGWSNPESLTFPVSASTPQIIIPDTGFATLLGFNAQTFPTSIESTTQSALSDVTPQLNPVSSLIVACSLVNNAVANPPDVLYPFTATGTSFGGLVESVPVELVFIDVNEGYYPNFRITLLDQNFRRVNINDPNIICQLIIRTPQSE